MIRTGCLPALRYGMMPAVLSAAFVLLLNACAFRELKKESEAFERAYALMGRIDIAEGRSPESVVVVVFADEQGGRRIKDYALPDQTGQYALVVGEGRYYVGAFEDANKNFICDAGERHGFWGVPTPIDVIRGKTVFHRKKAIQNLDIRLDRETPFPAGFPAIVNTGELNGKTFVHTGRIAHPDDALFDPANGSMGYWQPYTFLRQIGFGIYFNEPYKPGKIPVLFVHGAVGTPAGWKTILDRLDSRRYQAWFYYYPSGLGLEASSKVLNYLVKRLHDEYRFQSLYVIAHSMGGLVSRSFIIQNHLENNPSYLKLFISLSTPWGGVATAASGVEKAPVAVPSWYDVTPDSEFIRRLYGQSLPPGLHFYLFFGVKGDCSVMMANNDGTIEISSEIDYRAQREAERIFAFNEDHDTILTSAAVLAQLHSVMAAAPR
ncbi:MAG: lipase family alpha/beta hydrolase [Thermodesulfobacteriota bacterium]